MNIIEYIFIDSLEQSRLKTYIITEAKNIQK